MKKNIGKADKANRMFMIPLLIIGVVITTGFWRYLFGVIAVYEIYTVIASHCLVYQIMGLNSTENKLK